MNVFLRRSIKILLIWLFAIPISGFSQIQEDTVEISTYMNQPVVYDIDEFVQSPFTVDPPLQGALIGPVLVDNSYYSMTYNPGPGFVGIDYFSLIMTVQGFPKKMWYKVTVNRSVVTAAADFAETSTDTPIDIEVLINDNGTADILELNGISLVNNGTASFQEGESFISFNPAPGFVGMAYVNYTVCDDLGTCSQGTVTINVIDEDAPVSSETQNIFTKKNTTQVVVMPLDFTVASAPENGAFDPLTNTYTPNQDYVGEDVFVFSDGTNTITVQMQVLDFEEKEYTTNDKIFTTSYSPVEFNVLDNDFSSSCFEIVTQPSFGQIEVGVFPVGLINYTPSEGFVGVDRFTYSVKPPFCAGEPEIATVEVHVSNYEPSSAKYFFVTPKRTPLVLSYDIPVSNFAFEVTQQGELGEISFMPGPVDTEIYGVPIKGNNILVYIPHPESIAGTDNVQVDYCLSSSSGGCSHSASMKAEIFIIDPPLPEGAEGHCVQDCVFPGDLNHDGIVNVADLLQIGVTMGEKGRPRPNADITQWYGQYSEDWDKDKEPGAVNMKHVDSDGDSIISVIDTLAINLHYGKTHNIIPTRIPSFDGNIYLVGDVSEAEPGDVVTFSLFMGNENNPQIDVYGFTLPFEYSPEFFVPSSVQVHFSNDSWLAHNSAILQMAHNDHEGFLEAAFTRTNGISASGYGFAGEASVIIAENIEGFRPDEDEIEVEIGGGLSKVMNSAGQISGASVVGTTLRIKLRDSGDGELTDKAITEDQLKVYPNPAQQLLNVHLNGRNEFQRVLVHDITGRRIMDTGEMQSNHAQLNVSELDNGLYFMNVYTEEGILNKRFEVIKP